jgi:RNA polymerase sigma-70 factor (ECF subfamily)
MKSLLTRQGLPFYMRNTYDIFEKCKLGDAKAQRILYDLYKGKLMGLCRRYTQSREEAQDVLQEAFIRIFTHMDQVKSSDKLESWMKSIAVRTAINFYHKGKGRKLMFSQVEDLTSVQVAAETPVQNFTDEFLITAVNSLPDGCRIIFNMFAIEGYSHSEIAAMLQISEGTSRSQFHHAKYLLKEKLKCQNLTHYYEKFS